MQRGRSLKTCGVRSGNARRIWNGQWIPLPLLCAGLAVIGKLSGSMEHGFSYPALSGRILCLSLAESRDPSLLLSAGKDGTIKVWDCSQRSVKRSPPSHIVPSPRACVDGFSGIVPANAV